MTGHPMIIIAIYVVVFAVLARVAWNECADADRREAELERRRRGE